MINITRRTTIVSNVQLDDDIRIWLLEEEGFKSAPETWKYRRQNNVFRQSIPDPRSRNVECPTTDCRQSERRHHQTTGAGRQWIPDCWSSDRKWTGHKSAAANSWNWQKNDVVTNELLTSFKYYSLWPISGFPLYFGIKIRGLFKDFQGPWSCIFKDQFSTDVYSMDSIKATCNIYFCDYWTVLVDKNEMWH